MSNCVVAFWKFSVRAQTFRIDLFIYCGPRWSSWSVMRSMAPTRTETRTKISLTLGCVDQAILVNNDHFDHHYYLRNFD